MVQKEIRNELIKILTDRLELDSTVTFADQESLDGLGADSLDKVEIFMSLEEAFDIEISDKEADEADTVEKIVLLIEKKIAASETE